MSNYRNGSYSVSNQSCHIVWVTKYRYAVLTGDVQKRCRDILVQVCDSEDVRILKGVVSKDHIHMHVEYPPSISVGDLVKRLKGRSSRLLRKRYWGRHFWAVGYGAWSTGVITDEMVQEYLEHHKDTPNGNTANWIMES